MVSKKLVALCIIDVLKENSDENHPLTFNKIIKLLKKKYGFNYERKSIGYCISDLIEFGIDIIKVPHKGVYLGARAIEPSELTFIADALFSSRSVSGNHAKQIALKLLKELSKYQQCNYKYIYKADQMVRTNNKQLFYNIDIIQEAIEKGKKIIFKYNHPRFNSQEYKLVYTISPYYLVNSLGSYYLVCNNDRFDDLANYKIDKIYQIKIINENIKPIKQVKSCSNGLDIAKYANEHIYMFGGKTICATIKLLNPQAEAYVSDWFGDRVKFYQKNNTVYVDIKANEQALIFWCLQYADHCILIKPKETVRNLINRIHRINEIYKKEIK